MNLANTLGECQCWWTSESPRAHVAKFYSRRRSIRSVWHAKGAACQQMTLIPPETWSCPTLGLACVLMSRPISPVLSPDFWNSNIPRYFSFAWRASTFSGFKIDWNCNFVGLLHHPFWFQLVLALLVITFQFSKLHIWLRITDEGSVPEMRIWSTSFI